MYKKHWLVISIVLMLALVMSSCQSPTPKPTEVMEEPAAAEEEGVVEEPVEEEVAEPVTIQFWTWFPPLPTTEKIIAAFEAENPDIKVEITILESTVYQDKLPLSLAGGEELDLVAIQTSAMVDQLKADLQPLEPLLEEYIGADWQSMYAQKSVEQSRILADDGELYILPMGSLGSVVAYYNVEIFEEYGLEVPTNYAEFKSFADELTAQNPDILPVVLNGADGWFQDEVVLTLIGQTSPDFYNDIRYGDGRWDDPAYVQVLEDYKQMYDDGIFSMDVMDLDYGRALEIFYAGEAAILLQGTWEAGVISEPFRQEKGIELADVGMIPLPVIREGGTPSIRSFIELGMAVPHNSDNPEEAMMLLEYIVLGGGVDEWSPAFLAIPSKLGYEFPDDLLTSDAARDGFETLTQLVQNPSSDRNNVSPFSSGVAGPGIIEVINGADAQEVAENMQAEWESGRYIK
jgi:raffinose/stachyose/melibiose transport system substrate-binding protein